MSGAQIQAAEHYVGTKVVVTDPLSKLLTLDHIVAALPAKAQAKERSGFPWLLLNGKKEVPELATHFFKILGCWNAEWLPESAHSVLRDLARDCTWVGFVCARGWHHHFLVQSPTLEARLDALFADKSPAKAARLKVLCGLCVTFDAGGNTRVWPTWLVEFMKPRGKKILEELSAQAAQGEKASDVPSWWLGKDTGAKPPLLRCSALPGRCTFQVRDIGRNVAEKYAAQNFARGQWHASMALVNHPNVSAIIAREVQGGELECKLKTSFPGAGGGTSVTCGPQQVVFEDILATGALVKDFLDEELQGALKPHGFGLLPAPLKDAVRLIKKGDVAWATWNPPGEAGMVNLCDIVRYTVNLQTMKQCRAAMEHLKAAVAKHGGRLEEVTNKMDTDLKCVVMIFSIGLAAVARCHTNFFAQYPAPSGVFVFEVQVTTVKYGTLNKYSHVAYEISREASPGKGFTLLRNVLAPLGMEPLRE